MLDLRIMDNGRPIPLADLPAVIGRKVAYSEIGHQIDAMIAMLDDMAGDPDLEDNGDHEAGNGDELDASWFEWDGKRRRVASTASLQNEDDEDDDSDRCEAGDDMMASGPSSFREHWNLTRRAGDDADEECATWESGERQGAILADARLHDDDEDCGAETHPARIIQRSRIRATRCSVSVSWGRRAYRLLNSRAPLPIRANDL